MKNLLEILSDKRLKYILVGIPLLLVIYVFLLGSRPQRNITNRPITPTPTSGTSAIVTAPLTKDYYDPDAMDRFINTIETPVPLSRADQLAKQNIINQLNKQSGITQRTSEYIIEYVNSSDVFMVEITTIDVASAKQQVKNWFLGNGFSSESLCTMPVIFYLNFEIANIFRNEGRTFSPLAEGC